MTPQAGVGPESRAGIEEALIDIWHQVLPDGDVTRSANFFDLGGESISGMRIVALARKRGIDIGVRDIFERQTIAEISATISDGRHRDGSHTQGVAGA